MNDLLSIGKSGLYAAQAALSTTSNNIVNASTPGYSRQQSLQSAIPQGGVQISAPQRITEQYLVNQLWAAGSEQSYHQAQQSQLGQLESLLGSDGNSLSKGLDRFYASINAAALTPDSLASRETVLQKAGNLARQFNQLAGKLQDQTLQINSQLATSTEQANEQLNRVADLNRAIMDAGGADKASPQLLDARDNAVAEVGKIMDVRVIEDQDGILTLSLANGQPLVGGLGSVAELALDEHGALSLQFAGNQFALSDSLGGSLGGLLDFRDQTLSSVQGFVDESATHFATEVNQVLANGTDLNGNPGTALFELAPLSPAANLAVADGLTAEQLAFGQDGSPADNSNLLDLATLAGQSFAFSSLGGSEATLGEAYATQLGRIGTASQQSQLDLELSIDSYYRAQGEWSEVSSVNLDEEAANLIRYQQAYQANAKVIATADQLFETLLSSV